MSTTAEFSIVSSFGFVTAILLVGWAAARTAASLDQSLDHFRASLGQPGVERHQRRVELSQRRDVGVPTAEPLLPRAALCRNGGDTTAGGASDGDEDIVQRELVA